MDMSVPQSSQLQILRQSYSQSCDWNPQINITQGVLITVESRLAAIPLSGIFESSSTISNFALDNTLLVIEQHETDRNRLLSSSFSKFIS